jgi:hypothetical protein
MNNKAPINRLQEVLAILSALSKVYCHEILLTISYVQFLHFFRFMQAVIQKHCREVLKNCFDTSRIGMTGMIGLKLRTRVVLFHYSGGHEPSTFCCVCFCTPENQQNQ